MAGQTCYANSGFPAALLRPGTESRRVTESGCEGQRLGHIRLTSLHETMANVRFNPRITQRRPKLVSRYFPEPPCPICRSLNTVTYLVLVVVAFLRFGKLSQDSAELAHTALPKQLRKHCLANVVIFRSVMDVGGCRRQKPGLRVRAGPYFSFS
jgi:hypothetical protein